jgi:peptide/nickel transport system ATP-binding protein
MDTAQQEKPAPTTESPQPTLSVRGLEVNFRVEGGTATAVGGVSFDVFPGDYPHQFSGGMRQRVMIAMALVCHPTILIADEPTTALDVTTQAQILELMLELKEKQAGASIILITHDLAVVAETCQRVIVMYGGKVQEVGTVEQLFHAPQHPYTKGLLASLPASAEQATKQKRLYTIPGNVPSIMELPVGCKFCTRCADVTDRCRAEEPSLHELSSGQLVRCHLLEEAAGG